VKMSETVGGYRRNYSDVNIREESK